VTTGLGTLRVAAAQAESVSGEVAANVATSVALVEQAADRGARVVVLPELFLTGYDPDGWSRASAVRDENDPRLRPLIAVSGRRGVVVVVGAAVSRSPARRTAGRTSAAAHPPGGQQIGVLVYDGAGQVDVAYRKQHLTDEERGFFRPGAHGASIVVDGWELGLGVCYDGCFPEHAAAAATDGATGYLCPSAYYAGSEHRRDLYYAARALDNGIYVVFSGLTGRCGSRTFSGGSAVYDPEGRPVARTAADPGVVVADLDPSEVTRVRALNPVGRDRLADLGRRSRTVAPSIS
jgi:predicted amidohydrolase